MAVKKKNALQRLLHHFPNNDGDVLKTEITQMAENGKTSREVNN
jgi:hypothetical protein